MTESSLSNNTSAIENREEVESLRWSYDTKSKEVLKISELCTGKDFKREVLSNPDLISFLIRFGRMNEFQRLYLATQILTAYHKENSGISPTPSGEKMEEKLLQIVRKLSQEQQKQLHRFMIALHHLGQNPSEKNEVELLEDYYIDLTQENKNLLAKMQDEFKELFYVIFHFAPADQMLVA